MIVQIDEYCFVFFSHSYKVQFGSLMVAHLMKVGLNFLSMVNGGPYVTITGI